MAEDPEPDDLDRAIDALVARSVAPDRVPDGDLAAGLGQLSVQSIRAEAARTFTVRHPARRARPPSDRGSCARRTAPATIAP